jgi:hypothetical protein
MKWEEMTVITGAARVVTVDTGQVRNLYVSQTAANGNSCSHGVFLSAGTFNFFNRGQTATSFGLVDWYIDGIKFVSLQDWYSASTVKNVNTPGGPYTVTVATAGWHRITATVNGKNASSSNYGFRLTDAWFAPATD